MSQPHNNEEKASLQHAAEHVNMDKRAPVLLYLVILFAAAFLLLLLSFFMQQRANQAHVENLTESSTTALESVDSLLTRHTNLQEELDALQLVNDQLDADLSNAEEYMTNKDADLAVTKEIMVAVDWLSQIEGLYYQEEFEELTQVMAEFETKGYADLLPTSGLHTGYAAPAQRYADIQAAMTED